MLRQRRERSRESGNALIFTVLILFVLSILSLTEFSVLTKNQASSTHFNNLFDLRNCAENGVVLSFHDLETNASGLSGNFGVGTWTTADDYGKDGVANTSDEGEGDGRPTPGEPNTAAVSVGPAGLAASMICQVTDLGSGVFQIAATVTNESGIATVSKVVQQSGTLPTIPKIAALIVDPDVVIDFRGNSFSIDGNDMNSDGTAGTAGTAGTGIDGSGGLGTANASSSYQILPVKISVTYSSGYGMETDDLYIVLGSDT